MTTEGYFKVCGDCGQTKEASEFPRNRSAVDGLGFYCKPCHNARTRETVKRLYGNSRHYHLKKRYGVGADEVAAMIEAQGRVCAICEERPATQVDHDHATGEVRGILCLYCNAALGAFHDDPELISRAIAYVESNGIV